MEDFQISSCKDQKKKLKRPFLVTSGCLRGVYNLERPQ